MIFLSLYPQIFYTLILFLPFKQYYGVTHKITKYSQNAIY